MAGFIVPKFVYEPDPLTGHVSFVPAYPPVNKTPQNELEAVRHDSVTTSGIQQSVVERVDNFLTLDFQNVPEGDMAAWYSFMVYAVTGGLFSYHPDSTSATALEWILADTAWKPKRVAFQLYSFTLRMRRLVPTTTGS